MKRLFLILLLLGLIPYANAQISLSANTLTFDWVGNGFGDQPWPQVINITGTGTASLGACIGNSVICFTMTELGISSNLPVTAPGFLAIRMYGGNMAFMAVGSYSAQQTISSTTGCSGSCVITINYNVHTQTAPTVNTISGSQPGCSQTTFGSGAGTFYGKDTCPFLPDLVPGGTFVPPGAGGFYTDANLGIVVTQYNNASSGTHQTVCSDSGASNWNANGTYFCLQDLGGNFSFVNRSTLLVDYPQSSIGTFQFWDPTNSSVYYYFDLSGSPLLHKCTLGVAPAITCAVLYTYPGSATQIQNGNNCNVSADGWIAFWTSGGTDQKIGLLNLNNISQVFFSAQYSNALWGGMVHGTACVTPGIDTSTGYRYITRGTNGLTGTFGSEGVETLGFCTNATCGGLGSTIVRLNNWPIITSGVQFPASGAQSPSIGATPFLCTDAIFITGLCHAGAHGGYVAISGQQFIHLSITTGTPFEGYVALVKISSGNLMFVPVEAGGGLYAQFPVWAFSDTHNNCGLIIPTCTFDTDSDLVNSPGFQTITSFLVTNATATSPITVTSSPNYTGANGDVILIAGVKGLSGLNGLCVVASLSGATFQCTGTTGSGTYTASTGAFTLNTRPITAPYQNELVQIDYTHILDVTPFYVVLRLGKMRSVQYSQYYTDLPYYLQGHINCDFAQLHCNFNTNFGYPESMVVALITIGTPSPSNGGTHRFGTFRLGTVR